MYFKMTRVFLASFILMCVFLLPYFAYIFAQDIPFSRTTLDIGNLLWPLAIFAVLLYEDKKGKLGIWRNPSLGMNLKTAVLSLALGVLWQLIILLLTSLFDAPNTDPRESYTLATLSCIYSPSPSSAPLQRNCFYGNGTYPSWKEPLSARWR